MADPSLCRRHTRLPAVQRRRVGALVGRSVSDRGTNRSAAPRRHGPERRNAVPRGYRVRAGARRLGPGVRHRSLARDGGSRRAPRLTAASRILPPPARGIAPSTREVRVRVRGHLAAVRRVPEPLARWPADVLCYASAAESALGFRLPSGTYQRLTEGAGVGRSAGTEQCS